MVNHHAKILSYMDEFGMKLDYDLAISCHIFGSGCLQTQPEN